MEQETTFIQLTYTHALVQANARSRMTSAGRHACMKNWKNTDKSIIRARWNNTKHSFNQKYTHLLVQAHASSRMTSARRHACMKN